jgi:hypothetical protein
MFKYKLRNSGVVITLVGGLGNQLFQYAFGRAISIRNKQPLIFDLAWFDQVKDEKDEITTVREYALAPFELPVKTQCIGLPKPKTNGVVARIIRRCIRVLPRCHAGHRIYSERGFGFDADALVQNGAIWYDGYWQSYKYFAEIEATLIKDLSQRDKLSKRSQEMLSKIAGCDAICLHIRRGDYVSNKNAANMHGLCDVDYYSRGLEFVLHGLENPHCFIFSDEPAWALSNLNLPISKTVVDINDINSAHEDLWLMSACSHFVIANSSLSWWGAWLSTAHNKVVVAPRKWFVDSGINTSDLIPSEWVRL